MRILRLPGYFYPEKFASSHLMLDRIDYFTKNKVDIVVYTPTSTRGLDDNEFEEYRHKNFEVLCDGKVVIHRFKMFREGHNTFFRAFRYILTNLIQYFWAIKQKDIDVIFANSTPPTQGFLCGLVKRKIKKKYGKDIPLVYNLQDIFPDSLVNANMTKENSLIWKIGRKVEDYTYKSSDCIITISEEFKDNIIKKGVDINKIKVIPNWIDENKVHPVERMDNILFKRFGLDVNKFYITYCGNIGLSQNFGLLLDAAIDIRKELPNVQFVLIGDGAAKDDVCDRIKKNHIDNIIMLPFQPYEDIADVFSLGDVGLIISKPGIGRSSLPSKTWSIMASERPVLASFDEDSDLARFINRIKCGIVVNSGNKGLLVKAIKELYYSKEKRINMGKCGRKYVISNCNKEKCLNMYMSEILNVIDKSTHDNV